MQDKHDDEENFQLSGRADYDHDSDFCNDSINVAPTKNIKKRWGKVEDREAFRVLKELYIKNGLTSKQFFENVSLQLYLTHFVLHHCFGGYL